MKVMCWYYFYFITPCHRCFLVFAFVKRENQNTCSNKQGYFMKMKTVSFWVKRTQIVQNLEETGKVFCRINMGTFNYASGKCFHKGNLRWRGNGAPECGCSLLGIGKTPQKRNVCIKLKIRSSTHNFHLHTPFVFELFET